jgi:hypothetical protein
VRRCHGLQGTEVTAAGSVNSLLGTFDEKLESVSVQVPLVLEPKASAITPCDVTQIVP